MDALLATEGLAWIVLAATLSGLVRGFAGFGNAMVFLPVAGQFLPPFAALTALMVMDIIGPIPRLRGAARDGHMPDIARLCIGAVFTVPIGLWILGRTDPEVFRYAVSGAAIILLTLLITGVKYRGKLTPPLVFGTGGLGGMSAGLVGLPGPPVIFLYMASTLPVRAIRGNIYVYLFFLDILLLFVIWLMGNMVISAVWLGAALILPYAAGVLIGTALFRPEAERIYRIIAYVIIAASALSGLPIWD